MTKLYDGHVTKTEYGDGLVTAYVTEGLGHDWPSVKPNGDNPKGTYFDATPLIMDFFKAHPLEASK